MFRLRAVLSSRWLVLPASVAGDEGVAPGVLAVDALVELIRILRPVIAPIGDL
jgi:hypothetical protein